jgi:hypothetical protein
MTEHAFTNQPPNFALKREDVGQEGFNALVHRFPRYAFGFSEIMALEVAVVAVVVVAAAV